MTAEDDAPFWKKPLEALSPAEWESLCDGCGRCCLVKLEDFDTGRLLYTEIGCTLFDAGTCRCRDYEARSTEVPDCVTLTPALVRSLPWLPPTCAYRLRAEDKDLQWWHPLVSGRADTVIEAGVSVRGKVGPSEDDFDDIEDYANHIVLWPGRWPKQAKNPK